MSLLDALNTYEGQQGLGLLAAAGPRFDGAGFFQRLQEGMGSADKWKREQAKAELEKLQVDEYKRKVAQEQLAGQEQARIRDLMRNSGGRAMGSTNLINSALPADFQIGALPSISAKPVDYQELIRQGVPFEQVKALADSRNFGRDKVARTAEIEGPNGAKTIQGFDDYGSPVGQGVSGYVAPVQVDQGDKKSFVKPMAGVSFQMGMSPSNQIAIRGQNMTDARARDLNAISQQANGLKLGEKQDAINLAKAGQVASFDVMLGSLERLSMHPGLAKTVGFNSMFPTMPGSDSADFQAQLETFQAQAFLPMVSQLKGMGALSDAEGKKLTAAVGALNPRMGEKAFRESVARITNDMQAARARLTGENKGGASGDWSTPKSNGGWSIQKAN